MSDIAFVNSFHAALQITKALIGVRDAAIIETKMIELRDNLIESQSGIMKLQMDQSSLLKEVDSLKQKIVEMENWEVEKNRYQLVSPWPGFYAFALKESASNGEPPHWICQHCYEDRRKIVLQNTYKDGNRRLAFITCSHCSFDVSTYQGSERKYASEKSK